MSSLIQSRKIGELVRKYDYVTVEHPDHKDLDPMDMPIGGPVMMRSPEGEHFLVESDGSVIPYD